MRARSAIPAVMLLFGAWAAGCGDDATKTTGGSGRIDRFVEVNTALAAETDSDFAVSLDSAD